MRIRPPKPLLISHEENSVPRKTSIKPMDKKIMPVLRAF
jgi:hypothetical protein